MRLLAVRGRDLASLSGEFEVRFDASPLREAGVFAITGPTGAGKSTILDALCLALYDRTPRLASGRSAVQIGRDGEDEDRLGDQDTRSLLRRGAGEGRAEVDFVGRDGRRYRATWSARRARGRAAGRLQQVDVQFRDLDRDQVLSRGTRSETLTAIEACVGLSFDQFQRSVLLAQGDFDAFLKANANQRADLLERMTGAEVYSRLSMAAFERAGRAREALKDLETRIGEARPLDDAERERRIGERKAEEAAVERLARDLAALQKAVAWHERHAHLDKAHQSAQAAVERSEAAWRALGGGSLADGASQEAAEQAIADLRALDGALDRATAAETQARSAAGKAAKAHETALEESEAAEKGARALEREVSDSERWLAGEAAVAPVAAAWPRVHADLETACRSQDDVRTQGEALRACDERQVNLTRDREAADRTLGAARSEQTAARQRLATAEQAEAAADLEGTRRRLDATVAHRQALEEMLRCAREAAAAATAEADESATAARHRAAAQEHASAAAEAEAEEKVLTGRLDEARVARDGYLAVRDFAEHRTQLVAGVACPLCGATEHPFARQAPAVGDAIRAQEDRIRELERGLKSASVRRASKATEALNATRQAQEADARARRSADQRDQAIAASARARAEAGPLATALDPSRPEGHVKARDQLAAEEAKLRQGLLEAESRGKAVGDALKVVAAAVQSVAGAERAIQELEVAGARVQTERAQATARRGEAETALRAAEAALAEPLAGFPEWAGSVRAEGHAYIRALDARVDAFVARRHKLEQDRERLTGARERGQALANAATERAQEACTAAAEHAAAQAERARLQEDRRRRFGGQPTPVVERAFQAARDAHRTARERRADLERHLATDAPAQPVTEAVAARDAVGAERDARHQRLGEIRRILQEDDATRRRLAELRGTLEAAQARARVWEELSELIGSADGKKFRAFAQGLTLDVLLEAANGHLRQLRPRYRLERIPGANLDLQVIDRDLGDEVRSVSSLSGGETFLVSLALALGLASLSGREVRVDTLFIDEGFGTLDPESLESAIAVLDALQSEGRQVGIVSHVPGLAERLGARVCVEPVGVGCSRVRVVSGEGT